MHLLRVRKELAYKVFKVFVESQERRYCASEWTLKAKSMNRKIILCNMNLLLMKQTKTEAASAVPASNFLEVQSCLCFSIWTFILQGNIGLLGPTGQKVPVSLLPSDCNMFIFSSKTLTSMYIAWYLYPISLLRVSVENKASKESSDLGCALHHYLQFNRNEMLLILPSVKFIWFNPSLV